MTYSKSWDFLVTISSFTSVENSTIKHAILSWNLWRGFSLDICWFFEHVWMLSFISDSLFSFKCSFQSPQKYLLLVLNFFGFLNSSSPSISVLHAGNGSMVDDKFPFSIVIKAVCFIAYFVVSLEYQHSFLYFILSSIPLFLLNFML